MKSTIEFTPHERMLVREALFIAARVIVSEPIDFDRLDENATTFLKLLVLFAILSFMYAIGKHLGLVEDKNNYKETRDRTNNGPE